MDQNKFTCEEYIFVGTSKGADDILPFTNAGLSESITAIGLDLKPGHAYYVTVRGNIVPFEDMK